MKIPESVHETLKLASGVSACAGGVIAVITAIIGARRSSKSRRNTADLIVGEIMEKHSDLTEKTLKSVVGSELKSNEYYNSLDFSEKGEVTEMVIERLRTEIQRREAIVC